MAWVDILYLIIAAALVLILMLIMSYFSYIYIKTNSKRKLLISLWALIISIIYFTSYALLNLVSSFNAEKMMPILLFFVTLGLIEIFLEDKKGDK